MLQSATDAEVRNPVTKTGGVSDLALPTHKGRDGQLSLHFQMTTIAQINDFFRKAILTNPVRGGKCIVTAGVHALDPDTQMIIIANVRSYDTFDPEDDPYGAHDFGVVQVAGVEKIYWKIDIYADETLQWGAENPIKGYRVLTIMLASEN